MNRYSYTLAYTAQEWLEVKKSNFICSLDIIKYKEMRREISAKVEADNSFNPAWVYVYGGYCDLNLRICYLTLSYDPNTEQNYIIKQANC